MNNSSKVQADEKPLSIADIFLVFGEKCQECEETGLISEFVYYGRIDMFQFSIHAMPYNPAKAPIFTSSYANRSNIGAFIEQCFTAANLAMLAHSPIIAQPSKTCQS